MPKRESNENLRLNGGYRPDKHGNRERVVQSDDDPRPLAQLEGESLNLWQQVVPQLVELRSVSSLDSAELTSLSLWWGEYRKWADDSTTDAYKRCIAMASAYKQFRTLAAKFFLTPSDRIAMPCGVQTTEAVRRRSHQDANDRELEDLIS